MKKRYLLLTFVLVGFLLLSGCTSSKKSEVSKEISDVKKPGISNSASTHPDTAQTNPPIDFKNSGVVDLTQLSSTMVYAEVNNMMMTPEDYYGKTIIAKGPYYPMYLEETDNNYHFVVIEDALACCQQGIEFIWDGEHKFPDDYPAENDSITVTGIFGEYEEEGQSYPYILVSELKLN